MNLPGENRMTMCHETRPCELSLEECLKVSDAVISGVPSASYKIRTDWLKDGVVAINFSESKNFDENIKEKVSRRFFFSFFYLDSFFSSFDFFLRYQF